MIPTCWQLSLIARAANDDHLAERLWAIGWGMPAALVGLVVLGFFPTTFLIMCGGLFIFYGLTFGVFVMQLLLAKHVFDVRADVAWAIRNQNHTRYREEEFRERAAKRAAEALVSDALTLDDVPAAARAAEYESHSRFAHGEHQADIKPAGSSSTSHTPMVNPKQEQQTTQRPPPKPLKGEHRIEQSDDGETYDIID